MDLTMLVEYMSLSIVGICLCVGYMLKNLVATDKINRYIPVIMGVLGLVLNLILKKDFSIDVILGGMVSGLASTGMHQAFTNLIKNTGNDQIEEGDDQTG